MQVHDSIALVTGANRGIGKAFVEGLLAAGAKKVYAGARNPADVTIRGATPIEVDITKVDQVRLTAEQCADVTVLINNAGIVRRHPSSLHRTCVISNRRWIQITSARSTCAVRLRLC